MSKVNSEIAVLARALKTPQIARRAASAPEWVGRLSDARRQGRLEAERERLRGVRLLIVDDVDYIAFDRSPRTALAAR